MLAAEDLRDYLCSRLQEKDISALERPGFSQSQTTCQLTGILQDLAIAILQDDTKVSLLRLEKLKLPTTTGHPAARLPKSSFNWPDLALQWRNVRAFFPKSGKARPNARRQIFKSLSRDWKLHVSLSPFRFLSP